MRWKTPIRKDLRRLLDVDQHIVLRIRYADETALADCACVVRPGYVSQIKKELAAYKRFRKLTQSWVALELTRSQLRLEQARREAEK